jgi:hypothetical protein
MDVWGHMPDWHNWRAIWADWDGYCDWLGWEPCRAAHRVFPDVQ